MHTRTHPFHQVSTLLRATLDEQQPESSVYSARDNKGMRIHAHDTVHIIGMCTCTMCAIAWHSAQQMACRGGTADVDATSADALGDDFRALLQRPTSSPYVHTCVCGYVRACMCVCA